MTSELYPVLCHKSKVGGKSSCSAWCPHFWCSPGCDLPSGWTLLAHVQLFIHDNPQKLLNRAALNHLFPQSVLICRIVPIQVQHLVFRHIEIDEILVHSSLKFVPLDTILSFCSVLEDSFVRWRSFNSANEHCSYQDIPWFSKTCSIFSLSFGFFPTFFVIQLNYFT